MPNETARPPSQEAGFLPDLGYMFFRAPDGNNFIYQLGNVFPFVESVSNSVNGVVGSDWLVNVTKLIDDISSRFVTSPGTEVLYRGPLYYPVNGGAHAVLNSRGVGVFENIRKFYIKSTSIASRLTERLHIDIDRLAFAGLTGATSLALRTKNVVLRSLLILIKIALPIYMAGYLYWRYHLKQTKYTNHVPFYLSASRPLLAQIQGRCDPVVPWYFRYVAAFDSIMSGMQFDYGDTLKTYSLLALIRGKIGVKRVAPRSLAGKTTSCIYNVTDSGLTVSRGGEVVRLGKVVPTPSYFSRKFGPFCAHYRSESEKNLSFDDSGLFESTNIIYEGFGFRCGSECHYCQSHRDFNDFDWSNDCAIARRSAGGESLELKWKESSQVHTIPFDLAMSAITRYRSANHPAMGIIASVFGKDVEIEPTSIFMSLAKGSAGYNWTSNPDLGFQYVHAGVDTDFKRMNLGVVCNVIYPTGGLGYGAPHISKGNELDTIARRIQAPSNSTDVPQWVYGYAEEFLNFICTKELVPCTHDEVVEQMNRPSQKANRDRVDPTMDLFESNIKQLFTKNESVEIGKPARNICTVDPKHLYLACQYVLSASKHMESFPFWVWGVGSGESSRRLNAICKKYDKAIDSDFSKFDASLPIFVALFERMLLFRLFRNYYELITELDNDVLFQVVSTACHIVFGYGFGRMSGENKTAFGNTTFQAFIHYCSFRRSGMSSGKAWDAICDSLYGGDDGITPDLGQDLVGTVTALGMKVDSRIFSTNTYVRFLGRVYPNPRLSSDSYQDLAAVIKTMHLVNLGSIVDVEQGLVNFALGLSITDSNTPLLCDIIGSIKRAYPSRIPAFLDHDRWWVNHYSRNDPFTLDEMRDETLIFTITSQVLECDISDIYKLAKWFRENNFVVGSSVPEIHVSLTFKPTRCIEFSGIVLGKAVEPPVMRKDGDQEAAKIAIEHVALAALNTTVSKAVESHPDEMAAIADAALMGVDTCFKCNKAGHKKIDCPLKSTCRICKLPGHFANKCTMSEEAKAAAVLSAAAAALPVSPAILSTPVRPRPPKKNKDRSSFTSSKPKILRNGALF